MSIFSSVHNIVKESDTYEKEDKSFNDCSDHGILDGSHPAWMPSILDVRNTEIYSELFLGWTRLDPSFY